MVSVVNKVNNNRLTPFQKYHCTSLIPTTTNKQKCTHTKRKVLFLYGLIVHAQFREDKRCFLYMTIVYIGVKSPKQMQPMIYKHYNNSIVNLEHGVRITLCCP